jgi:glycosyltransferase involved in cell wall biosynthesis
MPALLQLVVPCYNEAVRLEAEPFLRALRAISTINILFVDDGSSDSTPSVLADICARGEGRITILTLPANVGKAAAVRAGILAAFDRQPQYVGFWDADLSTPLEALQEFMVTFSTRPNVDIVIGARVKLLGRDIRRRLVRHYCGRIFATAASFALGIAVYDTQCGAKLFRATSVVRQVFSQPFHSRWAFDVEILSRYIAASGASAAESRICEIPLASWRDVPGSKLTLRHAIRAAWDLARITRS